jgi:hypothetical protein
LGATPLAVALDGGGSRDPDSDAPTYRRDFGAHRIATPATAAHAAPFTAAPVGHKGEYFDDPDLTNARLTRADASIDCRWRNRSPGPSIRPDTFTARWTGWVEGRPLIDRRRTGGPTRRRAEIPLMAGQRHEIRVEYVEYYGGARMRLAWSSPSRARGIIAPDYLYPAP